MEVHTHTQTARKKWTHYFWEFLMLFLAVFCGFLAENYREHFIEHKREQKFMVSLLSDLRNDSITLNFNATDLGSINKGLDTLIRALRQPLSEKKNLDLAYVMYLKYGMTGVAATFNENTMSQLKNAGGLRIIRKEKVLEKINQYEGLKYHVLRQSDDTWRLMTEIENDKANYLFDFTGSSPILNLLEVADFSLNTDSLMNLASSDQLILLNQDPGAVAIFRNAIRSSKSMFKYFLKLTQATYHVNLELIAEIKKVYHLK